MPVVVSEVLQSTSNELHHIRVVPIFYNSVFATAVLRALSSTTSPVVDHLATLDGLSLRGLEMILSLCTLIEQYKR